MEERLLLRISLLVSIIGLVALFLIANSIVFEKVLIEDIMPDDIGRGIKACGEVENKFTSKKGHTFFDLNDESGGIKVVVFNSTQTEDPGNNICVTGRVDLYKGEIEIIADVIENA